MSNLKTLLFCTALTGLMFLFILDLSTTQAIQCEGFNQTAWLNEPPTNMSEMQWEEHIRNIHPECHEGIPWWVYVFALTPALLGAVVYFIPFIG